MHWNILADCLSQGSFTKVPAEILTWEYRLNLMLQHFAQVNADVIGLSEVDSDPLYSQLSAPMVEMGYDHYFVAKEGGKGTNGSAIFWKAEKFDCLEKNFKLYVEGETQQVVYARLQHKLMQKEFVFAETHLKAKKGNEEQRAAQTLVLKEFFNENDF